MSLARETDIIRSLVYADLKQRYDGSILGWIWVVLKPLLIFAVLNFVFSRVFAFNDPLYGIKLLTGLILWNFFSEASMLGLQSIVNHAHIVTKIRIPKWTVVVSSVLSACVNFLPYIAILYIFCVFYGIILGPLAVIKILMASLAVLALAMTVGLLLGPLFVRFRDLNQVWEVAITAGFFLTPIIYPFSLIPDQFKSIAILNPMAYIVVFARSAVMGEPFRNAAELAVSLLIIVGGFVLAALVFDLSSRRAAERL